METDSGSKESKRINKKIWNSAGKEKGQYEKQQKELRKKNISSGNN